MQYCHGGVLNVFMGGSEQSLASMISVRKLVLLNDDTPGESTL